MTLWPADTFTPSADNTAAKHLSILFLPPDDVYHKTCITPAVVNILMNILMNYSHSGELRNFRSDKKADTCCGLLLRGE